MIRSADGRKCSSDACYDRKTSAIFLSDRGLLQAMDAVKLREQGERCYFTMDAGPNVKVLCLEEALDHLVAIFEKDYRLIVSKTKDLSDES